MNIIKKLKNKKYPVIDQNNIPVAYRTIKEVYDFENVAAVGVALKKNSKVLLFMNYSTACRLVEDKEQQKTLSKLKELK